MQIDTKYIAFIDNDTVSIKNNWFREFISNSNPEDKIIATFNLIHFAKDYNLSNLPQEYKDYYDKDAMRRFHYYCIVIDNDYFKSEHNIYGYYGKKENYSNFYFDVGTEFYYFCKKNNIPVALVDINVLENFLLHILPNPVNYNFMLNGNHEFIVGQELKEFKKEFSENEPFLNAKNIAEIIGFDLKEMYDKIGN